MPSDDKGGPHFVAVEDCSMRRLVVALTVLALALSLVACGGGERQIATLLLPPKVRPQPLVPDDAPEVTKSPEK
jgi:hypothetical protein